MIIWIIAQQTVSPFLSHYGHSLPLCATDTGPDRETCPGQRQFSNATSAETLGVLTPHGNLAWPLHSTDAPPWEEHASGSFYCVRPGPGTNTQGANLKQAHSLGSRHLPLLLRPEPPSLDQPNHSQPAQCEQKDKWGGFLCSNIVEITD